ncbi:nephrocystin-3-like [Gigantopelta aegis]|uniref:nephrocystin-3-like n=1 Tax=Gigantopelta aegis TaxID=1735272 RepID=UPI001B88DA3E|nr:nephrocystin-3-like [Gigantopelta aegis]
MGTGGSFLRSQDDDDILGSDLDGNGVLKRIPIEMKPRGKLGLRSVGSERRKPKGGSLRSALSFDLENPEAEQIKKDFDLYRLDKEQEIASMQKKEQKLEMENKRMRAELLAMQNTCMKLRNEKEACLNVEKQAMARAAAFESDRDKVQRQFKIFRENKEYEIQNLLRAKRELENKLSKIAHGYFPEDNDTASRSGLGDSSIAGTSNPGDWWTALESEPSLGSTIQLHQPAYLRGPEFAHSLLELEGPFINVNKEDWSTALANMTRSPATLPNHTISQVVRLYVMATPDMMTEVDILTKEYLPDLKKLCESRGRSFVIVYLPYDDSQVLSQQAIEREKRMRKQQIEIASFLAVFLGDTLHRFTSYEVNCGHLDLPGSRPMICCFTDSTNKRHNPDAKELKCKLRENNVVKIVSECGSPSDRAQRVFTEVESRLKMELGIETKDKNPGDDLQLGDSPEQLCCGALWDIHCDYEQMERLNYAIHSSCELAFERYYERLNAHVSAAGPLPPVLVNGCSGSGRSLLLSKWIHLQQERCPSTLVLYHFVGSESSISADPIVMIRRLTAQLMQHVSSPPALTCDSVRLQEEFPRWLEKVSAKTPGGSILVLDSIDRMPQAEVHLKFLLDPLPVDCRVIVSCHDDTCQSWRSWPTLNLEALSNKNVKELLHAELATLDATISPDNESKILTHCRNSATCCPLYVMVLSHYVASFFQDEDKISRDLDELLSSSDVEELYTTILDYLKVEYEETDNAGLFKTILKLLCASRCGLQESELFALVPGLTWSTLCPVIEALCSHLIIKYNSGVLSFAHYQAEKSVFDWCYGKEDTLDQERTELIAHFSQFLRPDSVTYRVTDELPWLLKEMEDKETLHSCILNPCIFQQLYAKGRSWELLGYWQFFGADKTTMAQTYFKATKKMEEAVGQFDGLVTLPKIADLYETLGRFLKDMGLLKQALPALQRALEVRETALDPDHPVVARSLHQLAGLHAQWGKFATAEAYYRQALDIYENAYGSDHVLVAKELDALALLYQKQDKHDLAEPLRKRVVSIKKKSKPLRLQSGQPRGVDPLQRRTLHLEELAIGPDSPDLARTLNELGVLNYLQNNFDTAESFFKRSLEMREVTLGPDHPDLAQSLNNLAALYNDRKQFDKAEPLYERALEIRLKFLAPDSPGCAGIIKNLAMLYKKQGKFDKAEPLYKQAVEIREKSFGLFHPSVATALVNLAVLYSQQNRFAEAEPLYEQALKIYEENFGPHHSTIAETLRNLAVMKYEMKDYETAAKLYKRSTEIKESEVHYTGKVISSRSSSGDTNSTIKNILQT